jgi:hypothetical protein
VPKAEHKEPKTESTEAPRTVRSRGLAGLRKKRETEAKAETAREDAVCTTPPTSPEEPELEWRPEELAAQQDTLQQLMDSEHIDPAERESIAQRHAQLQQRLDAIEEAERRDREKRQKETEKSDRVAQQEPESPMRLKESLKQPAECPSPMRQMESRWESATAAAAAKADRDREEARGGCSVSRSLCLSVSLVSVSLTCVSALPAAELSDRTTSVKQIVETLMSSASLPAVPQGTPEGAPDDRAREIDVLRASKVVTVARDEFEAVCKAVTAVTESTETKTEIAEVESTEALPVRDADGVNTERGTPRRVRECAKEEQEEKLPQDCTDERRRLPQEGKQ